MQGRGRGPGKSSSAHDAYASVAQRGPSPGKQSRVSSVYGAQPVQQKAEPGAGSSPLSRAALRKAQRLNPRYQSRLGFDPASFGGGDVGSAAFATAVARYQASHGLGVDGIVGPVTAGSTAAPASDPNELESGVLGPQDELESGVLGPRDELERGVLDPNDQLESGVLGPQDELESGVLGPDDELERGVLGARDGLESGVLGPRDELESGVLGPRDELESGLIDEAFTSAGPRRGIGSTVGDAPRDITMMDSRGTIDDARRTGAPVQGKLATGWVNLNTPVQRRGDPSAADTSADLGTVAASGLGGGGQALPHLDRIQASFGDHDLSGVTAHVGGPAADACDSMGALGYATGQQVAFREQPDLHTAAHEAAHIVQQQAGLVQRDTGDASDPLEQHADQVADLVVQGRSAAAALNSTEGIASNFADRVQRKSEQDENGREEKRDAVTLVENQVGLVFEALSQAARSSLQGINEPVVQDAKKALGLVEFAVSLAVAGVAGAVSSAVASEIASSFGPHLGKGVGDQAKEVIKNGLKLGAESETDSTQSSPLARFDEVHTKKNMAARSKAMSLFGRQVKPLLRRFSVRQLEVLESALIALIGSGALDKIQRRSTHVEWVNFVARINHGAQDRGGNVSAEVIDQQGVIGRAQSNFLPGRQGLLEINLDIDFERTQDAQEVTDSSLRGMWMSGIHDNARATMRGLGRVKDAPVNKVVRAFLKNDRLVPPKPRMTVLITADGAIQLSEREPGFRIRDPQDLYDLARFLPLSLLE